MEIQFGTARKLQLNNIGNVDDFLDFLLREPAGAWFPSGHASLCISLRAKL
jgi:hypothetical protein